MPKRIREDSISLPPGSLSFDPSPPQEAHTPKYTQLDTSEPELPPIKCSLPPHQELTFATHEELDTHYQSEHTNRCAECKANLPSAHFLELHIAENHDSLTATKRDQGERTFACFLVGCEKVCTDWRRRRSHLVDKHGYPKNYDFLVVNHGVDGLKSMLRSHVDEHGHRTRHSHRDRLPDSKTTIHKESREVEMEDEKPQEPVQDLISSMSSLKMVPRTVNLGRKTGRSGSAKK